jgi:hypothetical protein
MRPVASHRRQVEAAVHAPHLRPEPNTRILELAAARRRGAGGGPGIHEGGGRHGRLGRAGLERLHLLRSRGELLHVQRVRALAALVGGEQRAFRPLPRLSLLRQQQLQLRHLCAPTDNRSLTNSQGNVTLATHSLRAPSRIPASAQWRGRAQGHARGKDTATHPKGVDKARTQEIPVIDRQSPPPCSGPLEDRTRRAARERWQAARAPPPAAQRSACARFGKATRRSRPSWCW